MNMLDHDLMYWSNVVTAGSYFVITAQLFFFVVNSKLLRLDSPDNCPKDRHGRKVYVFRLVWAVAFLFGSFISLCGATHLLTILKSSFPDNEAFPVAHTVVMMICAIVSLTTAVVCFRIFPLLFEIIYQFEVNSDGSYRHAETYLIEAVEMIKESIILMSDDLTIQRGNAVSHLFFGRTMIGTPITEYIHKADIPTFQATATRAMESFNFAPHTIEIRIKRTALDEPKISPGALQQLSMACRRPLSYLNNANNPNSNKVHCDETSSRHSAAATPSFRNRAAAGKLSPMGSVSPLMSPAGAHRTPCTPFGGAGFEDPDELEYTWIECTMCKGQTMSKSDEFVYDLKMVSRNIDDRKKRAQYQTVFQDTEEKERVNESKMRYISCVAHDLKTPLQSFVYSLDLLTQTGLHAEQREFIEQANVAVDLMKLTISQTMDISKALTGAKLQPRRTTVYLPSVVDRIKIIITGYGKSVPVTFEIEPDVCDEIITDEEWLWQMLLNLLTNACKYTDKGEIHVRISLCSEEALQRDPEHRMKNTASWKVSSKLPKLSFPHRESADTLVCEVIDTGVGIDPSKIGHIFDAFAQLQEGQVTGTGLGLFGVRTRAEGLLGTCGARHNTESSTGTGTVLWFAIPYIPNGQNDASSVQESVKTLPKSGLFATPFAARPPLVSGLSTISVDQIYIPHDESSEKTLGTVNIDMVGGMHGTDGMVRAGSSTGTTGIALVSGPMNTVNPLQSPTSANMMSKTESLIKHLKLTAMVVEDTNSVRKLMEKLLLRMGFANVVCYENGAKGLDAMMAAPVDIVFSDAQMPIMTGPEMVRRYRIHEHEALASGQRAKRQLIVAVTANGAECGEIGEWGFDEICPKPLQRNDIYHLVNHHFSRE